MKRSIRVIQLIAFSALMISMFQACGSGNSQTETAKAEAKTISATEDVKMVYFHATRRCATCNAVEKVTKETIAKHFENKIPFESLNREEDKNKSLVEKYNISGQTLLLISGNDVINLTNEAFLNARVKPERFESILIEKINGVIL